VAAGPIGRASAAATDATLSAQVLSYSRNSGLFAGVALDGTVIAVDRRANESAYGMSGILASQILQGQVSNVPAAAQQFTAALTRATNRTSNAPRSTPPESPGTPAVDPEPDAAPAPSDEPARTYPMEDPSPGAPPPAD
jgi:hypothetical protein